MARYLLIESRDPFESYDARSFCDLAQGLAREENEVTVFLVQNGVLPARQGSKFATTLTAMTQGKIHVLADDFSLKERAIRSTATGVKTASIDELVDLIMTAGTKAIWH